MTDAPTAAGKRPKFERAATSARNVFMAYFGTVAEGGVFLLLTPFLVRRLGLANYGLWTFGLTLSEWLQLLDLGLREAVMKYASSHQARLESASIRRIAEAAMAAYSVLGVVALAAVGLFAWLGVPMMVDDPEAVSQLRTVLVLLGVSAAIQFPAGVSAILLEGLSRFDLINLFRAGNAVLRLVLVVVALQVDGGVVGIAAAELVARLVLHVVRWTTLRRVYPDLVPKPEAHAEDLRRLFQFGIWNSLRQVLEIVATKLYEPIVALFAGIPAVGAFYAGRRLATIPAEAIVPLASVLFPLSAELDAGGRLKALRQSLLTTVKFAWTASIPVALLLALGASPIQTNWLGGRAPEAEAVLQVFAAVFLVVATNLPAESLLLGLGHARVLALCGIAQTVLTLGLGIPLTAAYGPEGLAWAALVGVVFGQAAVQLPLAAKRCGVPTLGFLRKALLPGFLAGLPVAIGTWFMRDLLALGGLAALAAWGGGAVLAYGVLIWFFGLDAEERAFFVLQIERLFYTPGRSEGNGG